MRRARPPIPTCHDSGDVEAAINELRTGPAGELQVWGSGDLGLEPIGERAT
jgi:hypothetical protein